MLYELAKPSMPEAARAEIIEQIEAGEPVKVANVRSWKRQARNVPDETKSISLEYTVKRETVSVPVYWRAEQPVEKVVVRPVYRKPEHSVQTVARPLQASLADIDADIILRELARLSQHADKLAVASDVEHIVARAPDRDKLVQQIDDISEFLALLKEAAVGSKPPILSRPPEMPPTPDDDDPSVSIVDETKTKH